MGFSKGLDTKGTKTVKNFNRLAYGLKLEDAVTRLGFLVASDTGLMFYDLLAFMKARIEGNGNHVEPVYAKVLIAIEQVRHTDIPYLLLKPQRVAYLTGLLASLNTDIVCARSTTSPVALRALETGFPVEMGRIAAVIDEAVGARRSTSGSFPARGGSRKPMQPH
jgi:hypothetical protein